MFGWLLDVLDRGRRDRRRLARIEVKVDVIMAALVAQGVLKMKEVDDLVAAIAAQDTEEAGAASLIDEVVAGYGEAVETMDTAAGKFTELAQQIAEAGTNKEKLAAVAANVNASAAATKASSDALRGARDGLRAARERLANAVATVPGQPPPGPLPPAPDDTGSAPPVS